MDSHTGLGWARSCGAAAGCPGGRRSLLHRDQPPDLIAHEPDQCGIAHPRQGDHVVELLHQPLEADPASALLAAAAEACKELVGRLGENAEDEGCGEGGHQDAEAIDEDLDQTLMALGSGAGWQLLLLSTSAQRARGLPRWFVFASPGPTTAAGGDLVSANVVHSGYPARPAA